MIYPNRYNSFENSRLNVASIIHGSMCNGPGPHSVIHLQGCRFRCDGCFNTELQPETVVKLIHPDEIVRDFQSNSENLSGVVISGGEPLLQPAGVGLLLSGLKEAGLRTVLYSGFNMDEIVFHGLHDTVKMADLLISGRYVKGQEMESFPYTSSKVMMFFSSAYSRDEFEAMDRSRKYEIRITPEGAVFLGFPPAAEIENMRKLFGPGLME